MKHQNALLKRTLLIVLSLTLAFALAACSPKTEAPKTDAPQTYKIGMEPTFPPFDTTDPNSGNLTGFDYDMMEAIAADQGFKLEWVNMGFDGLIPALQAGNIDIIASGMNAGAERRKMVDFSTTYYDSGLVVAVKEDNTTIKGLADLKPDMKVGAQIGTTGAEHALKLQDEKKIAEAKIYNGVDAAMLDLKNGGIAALINDLPVTKAYMEAQPNTVKIVGDVLNAEAYGYAVQKGNKDLLDKINKGMQNLKDSGKFQEIYDKWLKN